VSGTPAPAGHDDELADLLRQIQDEGDIDDIDAPVVGASLTKPTDVTRPERAAAAIVETEGGIAFDPDFASFGARALGLAVDLAILSLWLLPGIALIISGTTALVLLGFVVEIAGFAAATVVYARSVSRTGQSLGNRVAKTKVVDARNGRLVGPAEAGLRYALRFLVSIIFFIGFFVAFGDSQRRTFHDKMAGTVVTRPARATWSIDDEVVEPPTA
jgi:uncharacterized RDD family membrane protein YckC